jgi:hypothetical protein
MWTRIRRWFHDVLDWHVDVRVTGFDGCSMQGRCCFCGRRVLKDSQGNWFAITTYYTEEE